MNDKDDALLACLPDGVHRVTLEALGYRWYRVGGMGYALRMVRDSGAGVKW